MLHIIGLEKSFGGRDLFSSATCTLESGTRLALFGRNGSGKSTLFRMIAGEDHPDRGEIRVPKGYTIGYLKQHLSFGPGSALDEACRELEEHERYKGEIVLEGLGFSPEQIELNPAELSGGYQIRLNLARLILSQPNMLLLDEPTNYLDILSVRWLERYLQDWPGELIVVSHDRTFCDTVSTHSAIIVRGGLKKVEGNSHKLFAQLLEEESLHARTRENQLKERDRLMQFIDRFRAKASKASVVQSRVKALEKIEIADELSAEANLDFRFAEAEFYGRFPLEVNEIGFGFSADELLIKRLSFAIGKKDRIGVIGKNGRGKSTLLRLLGAEISPLSGKIVTSPNTKIGYFGQTNIDRLDSSITIADEVRSANERLSTTQVRTICGVMMFEGDDGLKKIKVLSGGERSRVMLAKILATPCNLLLLDEPTNHLDIESVEALTEALEVFDGAVVVVTHNEALLRSLATRLIVFETSGPMVFEGTYDEFLDSRGWEEERDLHPKKEKKKVKAEESKKVLREVEKRVSKLEGEIKLIERDLESASMKNDAWKISEHSKKLSEVKSELEKAIAEWERLAS